MNYGLIILLIPMIIIPATCWLLWSHRITWGEVLVQLLIGCFTVVIIYTLSIANATYDVETLNGSVTSKEKVTVSCSHSYSCNCRTVYSGSGKNRTSTRVCDTCYEHWHDYNWSVYSNVGSFDIDRIDRQGIYEPQRWSKIKIGEAVALPHGYTNYVKAVPESVFQVVSDFKGELPHYPDYYDYQYSNRVIGVPKDKDLWNNNLSQMLSEIGPRKQVNSVIVFTNQSPRFADALKSKWIGGKKNDVVIVIGGPYPQIKWVRVFSWAKHDIVNVSLRNALLVSNIADPEKTIPIVKDHLLAYYERRPMAEFKYLENDIRPPVWVIVVALILGTITSGLAAFFFYKEEVL